MASVLIVDDDAVLRDVLADLFGHEHLCRTAPTAEQALELLESEPFDVAIVDVSLPGMSGLELLGHILHRWPQTSVIIITGIDYQQHAGSLARMGAFDYLVKPFQLADAEEKIARAILRHEGWLEAVKESAGRALKSGPRTTEETAGGGSRAVERRGALRHRIERSARLLFSADISGVKTGAGGGAPTVYGYTRDLSMTGLSLIVPVLRSSDADLYGVEGVLRMTLSLPKENVEIQAKPVRYEWLAESNRRKSFLIGAQIQEMGEGGRLGYTEYLLTLH